MCRSGSVSPNRNVAPFGSQDRDRVHGGAGTAADLQWRHDEQELPPVLRGTRRGQAIEPQVVEQVHAHADDQAEVHEHLPLVVVG